MLQAQRSERALHLSRVLLFCDSILNMLPQTHRLRKEKDIKALVKSGKSVRGVLCGIRYRKNDLKSSRFAVVVGVKVSKKAVERNRLRRQIRAVIHEQVKAFAGGYDVAILIRSVALGKKAEELEKDVIKTLKKTPLL